MKKKIVFLPYDFDTAIGTNNEGSLVFGYNLEDIDQVDGEDVYDAQQSALWKLVREMYYDEIMAMYKSLRSSGKLSYNVIEKAFEEHQEKWPEAIFNEDSYYKYLAPLVEKDSKAYLSMLQGSKEEQRKWWLYNRFRYMDSKYNAGDALTDVITLRGFEKSDISLTPYADIYPTIKYGSYLVQTRGTRNVASVLTCPLDALNNTEIYIYSASQLLNIGDLSGLKVGYAEFAYATKIDSLKVGDNTAGYTNPHLLTLYPGNSKLLKKIDARNCTNFGTGDQKVLDVSSCSNIEEVYLDGTKVLGCSLPNGGYLKKLHLPGTITNLTIANQTGITEFVCPDYSNISTLNLENVSSVVDIAAIAADVATGCRVRLFNFYWNFNSISDAVDFMDLFDGCTGIDSHGNNVPTPQIFATIHVPSATGDDIEEFESTYPDLTLVADETTYYVRYYSQDGLTLLHTESVLSGGTAVGYTVPEKADTAQYDYTAVGWNTSPNATEASEGALANVTSNRNLYAAYSVVIRTYTVTFVTAQIDGGQTMLTLQNVAYGTTPEYTGATPVSANDDGGIYSFASWSPAIGPISGDTTYTAVFNDISVVITYMNGDVVFATEKIASGQNGSGPSGTPTKEQTAQYTFSFIGWNADSSASAADANALNNVTSNRTVYAIYSETVRTYTITFIRAAEDGGGTLQTLNNVAYGTIPLYTGATPTTTKTSVHGYLFKGWNPTISSVIGDQTYVAVFIEDIESARPLITREITMVDNSAVAFVGKEAFRNASKLTIVSLPSASIISEYAFFNCVSLSAVSLPEVTLIRSSAFQSCGKLTSIYAPLVTEIGFNAFAECYFLSQVSFPMLSIIEYGAFSGCSSLNSIYVPSVTNISSYAFYRCGKLEEVSLPACTYLGTTAFGSCGSLRTVYLSNVSVIGSYVFTGCSKLSSVIISASSVPTIGLYAFNNVNNFVVYVLDDLVNNYKTDANWSNYVSRIKGMSEL